MAGAVHLETQHTAASAKDIEMWLCVAPRLLAMADTAPSSVQAKCNVPDLVLARHRLLAANGSRGSVLR